MMELTKYKSETRPDWCPGCGDFGVLNALVQAVKPLHGLPRRLLHRMAETGRDRVEPFRATEITDDDKPAVLRAYLKKWKWEVGVFFDGVDAKASDETLRGIAPGYPIFRIEPAKPAKTGVTR